MVERSSNIHRFSGERKLLFPDIAKVYAISAEALQRRLQRLFRRGQLSGELKLEHLLQYRFEAGPRLHPRGDQVAPPDPRLRQPAGFRYGGEAVGFVHLGSRGGEID